MSKLDEILLNPQVRTCSAAVPGTYRDNNSENWEPNANSSLNDPYVEVDFSACQISILAESEPDEASRMVTGVREEIPYCSSATSSGKIKKARSTSQPHFCSESTPATIEANEKLLALQQLSTNSNSANFNDNINRVSKLPKSLTTTMPAFDGKSENFEYFELFEDLFQTSVKINNQLTEEDEGYYFQSLMRGVALQTFKNNTSLNREKLGEILTVFRRKCLKPQSMVTAKRLVFNPANQKLFDFLDELQNLAKNEFGVAAQVFIEQFIYAKSLLT